MVIALLTSVLYSLSSSWEYGGAADAWGGECSVMGVQSPIDIAPSCSEEHGWTAESLVARDAACWAGSSQMSGSGAAVHFAEGCRGRTVWDGTEYTLTGLRLRSPSEHSVSGGHFPMEVQFEHVDGDGNALIVALFVAAGTPRDGAERTAASWLGDVVASLPSGADGGASTVTRPAAAMMSAPPAAVLAAHAAGGFTAYNGSLTTPPCTAGVVWIVAAAPLVADERTLALHASLLNGLILPEGDGASQLASQPDGAPAWAAAAGTPVWDASQRCNNRPTQALGEFRVVHSVRPRGDGVGQGEVDGSPLYTLLFVLAAIASGQLAQFAFKGRMVPQLPPNPWKRGTGTEVGAPAAAATSGNEVGAHAKRE